jgi:hypothetical protein
MKDMVASFELHERRTRPFSHADRHDHLGWLNTKVALQAILILIDGKVRRLDDHRYTRVGKQYEPRAHMDAPMGCLPVRVRI